MKLSDFAANPLKLDLFTYFEGKTTAWGYFEDRFGTVKRQFTVDIVGEVAGNTLTLTEDFIYNDGEKDQRIWVIEKIAENKYTGRAADVIGTATGTTSGNSFNWQYQMKLKVKDDFWHVNFDDWMFLQPDGVLLNRAIVTKWGLEVGRVQLFFKKEMDTGLKQAS